MINRTHLKEVVEKTLKEIDLYSDSAVNLLMGTAAQETRLGQFLKQLYGGPALGIMQMEPKTFEYHLEYLNTRRLELKRKILECCFGFNAKTLKKIWLKDFSNFVKFEDFVERYVLEFELKPEDLVSNLAFAICMSRVHYFRIRKKLPKSDDLKGLAAYWKKYYNSELGKGTEEEFLRNYKNYCR